jgi:hypothetical protein
VYEHSPQALRAYGAVQAARPLRDQEADVYATLSGRLRDAADSGSPMDFIRARADARRLFTVLETLVLHPSCELPQQLRGMIASVAGAALRDIDGDSTDLMFLAELCDNFAQGLSARPALQTEAAA